ncbi:MAG: amidohydrolase [Myxococcales bacterium]|nr:amidohydrolase [Myxococcales bacterium]MCB9627015.1 amidohydrolase [Sandaracinaceae bacterium]
MILDCHAHFDPQLLDVPTALRKMDEVGVARVALIPPLNGPIPDTPKHLLAVMRHLMNGRGRPLAERIHRHAMVDGGFKLGKLAFPIFPLPDNEPVAEVLRAHPTRFLGWVFLNPAVDPTPLDTLERYRTVPGMVGVKLHPHWHDYRTEVLGPVLARCQELGLPVLIHLGFGERGDFRAICRDYPRLNVISAHAGFPFYKDLWRFRDECPNLHVDLSSPYIDERLARATVAAMGAERCLYGTDAPYGFHAEDSSYDYGEILGWVARMPLSEVERDAVLMQNAARLLRLE